MAQKWSDVVSSSAFQALSLEEQEEARRQYFDEIVAPKVPDSDRNSVREQFLSETALRPRESSTPSPSPAPKPAEDQGIIARIAGLFRSDRPRSSEPAPNYTDPMGNVLGGAEVLGAASSDGVISRIGKALRPEPRSVMEGYQYTPQQQQADLDRRLSYGAGPISQQTVLAAGEVRRGEARSNSPIVNRVAQAMSESGDDTFGDLIARAKDPEIIRGARMAKAEEFRSPGEWAIDTLSSLGQGVTSLVELPVNIIAPSSDMARYLRDVQKDWQAQESDVLKAQRENLRERLRTEDGFLNKYVATVQELVTNPAMSLSEAVKQVPMFLGVLGGAKAGAALAGGAVGAASRVSPTLALGEAISGGAIRAGAQAAGSTAGGVAASAVMAGGDAAGSVYERLTDKKQTPLSVWEQNEDFRELLLRKLSKDRTPEQAQALVDRVKSDAKKASWFPEDTPGGSEYMAASKEAIEEIATTKARLAAAITAPLGLFGFMGAEAAIASRGLVRAATQAAGPKTAAKTFGKEVLGEQLEEGGTQLGANVITRTVNPKQSLTEGVPEAMGTALVTSTPFAAIGAAGDLRARQEPFNPYVDQAARTLLAPQTYDPRVVSPELTVDPAKISTDVSRAASVDDAITAAETAAGTLNLNLPPAPPPPVTPAPLDLTAPAGLAPAPDLTTGLAPAPTLPGVDPAVEQQYGFDQLRLQPAGITTTTPAAPAPMNAPRPQRIQGTPVDQLTDEQLEQIAGDETIPAITRRGASVELTARRGGAATETSRVEPTLDLQSLTAGPVAGTTSSGQQRVEPTLDLPDVSTEPAAPGAVAQPSAAAAQPGYASTTYSFLSIPQQPGMRDVSVAPVGGEAAAQSARETAQRSVDAWSASAGQPTPAVFNPASPELDSAVNQIAQAVNSQFAGRIYAYNDNRPEALNGIAIGKVAFVNTANVDVNVARTSLHEFKHTVEQIAAAEERAGQTGTAAQKFVADIDSLYDDMSEAGKRAYLTNFLAKDELAGIADATQREARIQELLAAPETRSEMTADFLGNRATDKQFWADVAQADPDGFRGFVQKWMGIIDNLLAQLRGTSTQGRKESAKVDEYVRDLNRAKMVAREALIAYSKATRAPTTEATQTEQAPAFSARQPGGAVPVVRIDPGKKKIDERLPELMAAADRVASGEMTPAQYGALANSPQALGSIAPYDFVPAPATDREALSALTENKRAAWNGTNNLQAGERVGLRLDIPAYKDHGVWVNSIHPAGKPTAYSAVSAVTDAVFPDAGSKALGVAQGKAKAPFARIEGRWSPITPDQAVARMQEVFNDPQWTQVGYNPLRHSYFFDRKTGNPVTAAEEVIQIGPLVLAKNATIENAEARNEDGTRKFAFSRREGDARGRLRDEAQRAGIARPSADVDRFEFGGISYSLRQIEQLNDVPEITMQDLVGETVFPILADLTAAGYVYMGKELRGGPFYTLLPSNSEKGLIWANDAKGVSSIKEKKAARGVIGLVVAMKQDSHATNNTISNIIFRAVEDAIQRGDVAKRDIPKLDQMVRKLADRTTTKKRKVDGKEVKETVKVFPKFAEFPGFSDRATSEAFLRAMPFEARGLFFEEMSKGPVEDMGLGAVRKVIQETVEPELRGLNMGDVVMAIRFTPGEAAVELGPTTNTPLHDSYRYAVKGEVVGKFKRPISFRNVWVDLINERAASGESNVTKDYRSLTLRKPEQLITQEIADQVTGEPYRNITSPAEAKSAVAAASNNWSVIDRPAGAGVKEFLRTSRVFAEGKTVPSYNEAKKRIKEGRLKIFRLAETENWFSVEKRGNRQVMTSIMVAQPGVRNETLLGDMIDLAKKNGATHIEINGTVAPLDKVSAPRRIDPIIEELSAMTDNDLVNLGIDPAEVRRLGTVLEEDDAAQVSPTSVMAFSRRQDSPADRIKWRKVSDVKNSIRLDKLPDHILPFANFMQTMAEKADSGGLTSRDVIKAYTIARSSMNRGAITTDKVRASGLQLPARFSDAKIRPEGAFGYWLLSPVGQRYLNSAEVAIVDEAAIADAVKVMAPFGTQNTLGEDLKRAAGGDLHTRLPAMTAAIAKAAEGKNAVKDWQEATDNLYGVREAKKGFLGSLLGFGQLPTFDARQININVREDSKEDTLRALSSTRAREVVAKLSRRMDALSLTMDAEFTPFYRHLVHHAVWDAVGGTATTHEDVIESMLMASRRQEEPTAESVEEPTTSSRRAEDIPRDDLAGRRVSVPVLIEDTGQTATITLDAKEALDDVDEREGAMQRLLECLRK